MGDNPESAPPPAPAPRSRRPARPKTDPANLPDEQLLDLRFCDLAISLDYPPLARCIARLHGELEAHGILFRPECYLADEWLCPDREPVIGIPFYLAHPRLRALEMKIMLEVEGGDERERMMLLRHECGHALNYAYRLYRRPRWRELFGPFSADYPDRYKYRPYSKRFVRHLQGWYAQYHPDEDFAETFAVWLTPRSQWAQRYRGWEALGKLEYVDRLVRSLAARPPAKPTGEKLWDIARLKTTLRTHYKRKRSFYAEDYTDFHDPYLRRIFSGDPDPEALPAAPLLRRHRKTVADHVCRFTGEKKYIVHSVLKDLTARAAELNLTVRPDNETDALLKLTAYCATLAMNYLHTGTFRKEKT